MNNLTTLQNGQLTATHRQDLANISPVIVWLANFNSPQTQATYKNAVLQFSTFSGIEPERLHEVSLPHLIAWRETLKQAGHKPRTINNKMSALSSLFKYLCQQQHMKTNPAEGVKRLRVDQSTVETPALTPEQVRVLLDTPTGDSLKALRDRALLYTFFYTGCRVSEPTHLNVGDFYNHENYFVLDFTVKGGKKNKVAIHQELQIALRTYLTASGHEHEPNAPLFLRLQPKGTRQGVQRRMVDYIFQAYREKAGFPRSSRITPHSARATFVTDSLNNNCRMEHVQQTVGHSSITTTQAYDKRQKQHKHSASFKVSW